MVFLDIETTGLSPHAAHVTVVGLAFAADGERSAEQYFVDRPCDEADVLRAVARELREFTTVVTYNGQGFDLPFLEQRAALYQLRWPRLRHWDLLPEARRWRRLDGSLPDCRLQTVLAHFGFERHDHASGYEMVLAYHDWLHEQCEDSRALVLDHNADDILHLPDLADALTNPWRRERPPSRA